MTLLHAASREALASAELKLLDLTDFDTSGDELFAVVGVLNREPALRRALADSSADEQRRTDLARQLFAGKLAAATLDLVVSVVTSRWSNPRELVDGIESLARTALLVGAERTGRLDPAGDE